MTRTLSILMAALAAGVLGFALYVCFAPGVFPGLGVWRWPLLFIGSLLSSGAASGWRKRKSAPQLATTLKPSKYELVRPSR